MWLNKRSSNRSTASSSIRSSGFTLIEVLVSIAIFSTLSLAAYQVVNQIQRSNEVSLERSTRINELQRSLVIMDSDFRQMALRQFRTDGEEPTSALLQWQEYLLDSDAKGVMFTRLGWHNPQQQFPRGEVTKVGYRLKESTLERVWWRYPDTPAGQAGVVTPLLTQVESLDLRFYDGKSWQKQWQSKLSLPKAVSVVLTLEDFGEIERIYLTSGGSIKLQDNANSQDSSSSSQVSGGNNG